MGSFSNKRVAFFSQGIGLAVKRGNAPTLAPLYAGKSFPVIGIKSSIRFIVRLSLKK